MNLYKTLFVILALFSLTILFYSNYPFSTWLNALQKNESPSQNTQTHDAYPRIPNTPSNDEKVQKPASKTLSVPSMDVRCTQKAIGEGLCMAMSQEVEFNQNTEKCELVNVGGCNFLSPFSETGSRSSEKDEMSLCKEICENTSL